MTTGCYETSLLLFANARGTGKLLTVKWLAPGSHRKTNAQGGGGECSRLELTHTLNWQAILPNIYRQGGRGFVETN